MHGQLSCRCDQRGLNFEIWQYLLMMMMMIDGQAKLTYVGDSYNDKTKPISLSLAQASGMPS